MASFTIGLSALRANQFALQTISHNIANAGTEGYHRRSVRFESRFSPFHPTARILRTGSGVGISSIESIRLEATEASLTRAIGDSLQVEQSLQYKRQIERGLVNANETISDKVNTLYAELQRLTGEPASTIRRQTAISAADELAATIRQASEQLIRLKDQVRFELGEEIDQSNAQLVELTDLNEKILFIESQGQFANDELDKRDSLVNSLAESIGLRRTIGSHVPTFQVGNTVFQLSHEPVQVEQFRDTAGKLSVGLEDSDRPLPIEGGRVGSMLETLNSTIPLFEDYLEELTVELARQFDSIHARGVGDGGPFTHLRGVRGVKATDVPLAESGAFLDLQAGDLTISVVDPSGARQSTKLAIDPAVDSLDDLVSQISSIAGLSAAIDPSDNSLQIYAQTDYQFDFTSHVDTTPDLSAFSGSATPKLSGAFTGSTNDSLTLRISGNGEVGVTDNLKLDVFSESGTLLKSIDIGSGYEANQPIDLGDGISVQFSGGTVADGDEFSFDRSGRPDETGILPALGLNSLFTGTKASDFAIREDFLRDPDSLALSDSGDTADTSNLLRFLEAKHSRDLAGGLTVSEFALEITTTIGFSIESDISLGEQLSALKDNLEQERNAISGVDLNEELVYLQNYQRSYEAAAKIVQSVDQMLAELFNILR